MEEKMEKQLYEAVEKMEKYDSLVFLKKNDQLYCSFCYAANLLAMMLY